MCLSYVWGDTRSTRASISLNNRRYGTGPNLHSLLDRLRALGIKDEVWIDALCINQNDEKEKTEQVKLMGKIYSGAREVLIGLEDADQHTRQPPCHTDVKATIVGLAQNSHLHELDAFTVPSELDSDTSPGKAFRQLLKSPWFSRTWVVQEVCLSKKASLLCSWGTVSWQTFVKAFRNWNYHRTKCCSSFAETFDEELTAACHRVYCAVESLDYTTNNLRNEQHLLELMLTYQHLAVRDDRDKIFAFQGLHTAKGELPPPDYSKRKEEVYTKMAVWMLEDARSLMLLALDLHEGGDLPSWVPNFSARPPIEPNYWRSRLTFYGTYDCSKGFDWYFEYQGPGTLRLSGTMVDHIQYVARPTMAFRGPAEHSKLLREWYAFAGGGIASLPSPEALNDTFVETMIAGCTQDETGIRRADAKDLADWKEILFHLIQDASLEHHQTSSRLMACHMTAILNRTLFRTYSNWAEPFPICRIDVHSPQALLNIRYPNSNLRH